MGMMDRKRGMFNPDRETDAIFQGVRGWRDVNGDWLMYYRYDRPATVSSSIYGESVGQGRIYLPPVRVPCMHVTYVPGPNENGVWGFYDNNAVDAIVPFDLFVQMGMSMADIDTRNYLRDRVVYNNQVFRTVSLAIRGKIQTRSTMVGLTATQVKPDELIDDVQFQQWSA